MNEGSAEPGVGEGGSGRPEVSSGVSPRRRSPDGELGKGRSGKGGRVGVQSEQRHSCPGGSGAASSRSSCPVRLGLGGAGEGSCCLIFLRGGEEEYVKLIL